MEYIKRNRMDIEILDNLWEKRHFHQDIEILYALDGVFKLEIGNREVILRKDDIYVINANKPHGILSLEEGLMVKLSVTYRLFSDVFVDQPLFFLCDSTSGETEKYRKLRSSINRLLRFFLKNLGSRASLRYVALCYDVLDILAENFLAHVPEKKRTETYDKIDERIDAINNYIGSNYSQPLSLKSLSNQLYLSEGYLSRFFKKNYGMSFSDYLTNIRLHHAMEDLIYTDLPITKIVYSNGFSNQTVFGKNFKNVYGATPSAFRKKVRQEQENPKTESETAYLYSRLEDLLDIQENSENISTDQISGQEPAESTGKPLSPSLSGREKNVDFSCNGAKWAVHPCRAFYTVNVGMAEDLVRSELQEAIVTMKTFFGIEYVRFCNVFTPALLIYVGKGAEGINFSKIDRIFDFLQKHGIKPHIELGMKPRRIMKNLVSAVNDSEMEASKAGPEYSLKDWEITFNALMNHWEKRYGDDIDQWRIELWYAEEKWEQRWDVKEYFSFFQMVYETVRKYSPTLEVGGCGLKFDYLESHIYSFLSAWSHQPVRPDFISALYYAYERGTAIVDQSFRRSTDSSYLLQCIQRLKHLLKETKMDGRKICLTEWNLTVSDRNYINDTCFKGAYVMKNLIDSFGQVDDMAYFIGSDCVTEYYDSNEPLYGGTGLISRDGILKPSGHACHFMHRLYAYEVARDANILVTTNGRGAYGLVCHNLIELNERYYFTREDAVKKENIDTYFQEKRPLTLRVQIKDVALGAYQQKICRVSEKNGSVLDLWKQMDFEKNLEYQEIFYLKNGSMPLLTMQKVYCTDGCLHLDIELEPNEFLYMLLLPEEG